MKSTPRTTWPGWNYKVVLRDGIRGRGGWCTYHDLFRLCKVVLRIQVQLHSAQLRDRHEFLRYDLGGIEQVESKPQLILFVHDLNAELVIS